MIDSVLKGTGNSRFLKSAVPAGTSWADALAMLQAGTFPIDFNGINTEGFQQVGTPLNKANLLKDATAARIGLPPSTTPDGMFQALGNTGELHVWRKTVVTSNDVPAGYTLGASAAKTLAKSSENSGNSYATFYISSSISVDDAGNVTMNSPATVDIWQGTDVYDSDEREILGKFIKFYSVSNSVAGITSDLETGIYFIPNSAEFTRYRDGKRSGYTNISACQKVNPYPLTPAGTTTTYPVSTNPNAYQEGDDAKAAGYVLGDVKTGSFAITSKSSPGGVGTRWNDSTALSVSDDGVCTLATTGGTYIDATTTNAATTAKNELQGKFAYCQNTDTDFTSSVIVFFPSNTTFTKVGNIVYADRYQPVTGYAAIPAGTTIEYLGKLGDKARVQVLSYIGTGTYGSSNPNSLTFDFVPKLVIITGGDRILGGQVYMITGDRYARSGFHSGSPGADIVITWNQKKVLWYCYNSSQYDQMNVSGQKYSVIAIG